MSSTEDYRVCHVIFRLNTLLLVLIGISLGTKIGLVALHRLRQSLACQDVLIEHLDLVWRFWFTMAYLWLLFTRGKKKKGFSEDVCSFQFHVIQLKDIRPAAEQVCQSSWSDPQNSCLHNWLHLNSVQLYMLAAFVVKFYISVCCSMLVFIIWFSFQLFFFPSILS